MEYHINLPVKQKIIDKLAIGDIVYLTGTVYTARDKAHLRIIDYSKNKMYIPFDLNSGVIYHCGPLIRKEDGAWKVVSAGPTTSNRLLDLTPYILEKFNVKFLIGKGGMVGLADEFKRHSSVYLAYTGGCAALASQLTKKINGVYWEDFGMAEAVWELYVEDFGPLIVGIDSHGNDIFKSVKESATKSFKNVILNR